MSIINVARVLKGGYIMYRPPILSTVDYILYKYGLKNLVCSGDEDLCLFHRLGSSLTMILCMDWDWWCSPVIQVLGCPVQIMVSV